MRPWKDRWRRLVFERSFSPYRRELARRYGEEAATGLHAEARRIFLALRPVAPRFPGRLNLFNFVIGFNVAAVSVFRALRKEGRTDEEAAGVLYSVAEAAYPPAPAWKRRIVQAVFFSRSFLSLARRSAALVREHPEGWVIDYVRGDGVSCDWRFECTECGVVKYLRRNGAAGLAPFCNYVDYLQSRAFGLGMRNPETIGAGATVCRESFRRGRDTPMPTNLAPLAARARAGAGPCRAARGEPAGGPPRQDP